MRIQRSHVFCFKSESTAIVISCQDHSFQVKFGPLKVPIIACEVCYMRALLQFF